MSSGVPWIAADRGETSFRWLVDYIELTKPRIGAMVLMTVAIAAFLGTWGQPEPLVLLSALIGTGLVAASASVWNHWWEQETDSRMRRTCRRCLPAGRLPSRDAAVFGATLLVVGIFILAIGASPSSAIIAMTTWFTYVVLYTPLKRHSVWNTLVGAIPGALPVLIGWTAMRAPLDARVLALVGVVFFWQFPHFMAIAWRYRQDYAAAGMRMLTVVDPSGRRAGRQALLGSLALVPTSLIPAWTAPSSVLVTTIVLVLSIWFCATAFRFYRDPCDASATRLLRGSLIYLPAAMLGYGLLPWLT